MLASVQSFRAVAPIVAIATALFATICCAQERSTAHISVNSGTRGQEAHTFYVFVNDECLGYVGKRTSKTFEFTPSKDGKNTLYVEDANEPEFLFGRRRTETLDFEAGVGSRTILNFEYCYGGRFVDPELKVKEPGVIATKADVKILGIDVKPKLTDREIDSEILNTPPGVEQEYELERTIERSVSFTTKTAKEAAAGVDLKFLSAEVRGTIEKSENQSLKQTELIRRNVKVNGNTSPLLKVEWIGSYRSGVAELTVNGEKRSVPFEILVKMRPNLSVPKTSDSALK